MIADGARDRLGCGADEADGVKKFVGLHLPEHADAADGVADLTGHVTDRRGDRAQADLILAVFYGVALLADAGELGRKLLHCRECMGRIGLELCVRENAAALGRGAVGKKELSLRRAVDRQSCADLGHNAKTCPGLLLRERHDRGAVEDGQKHALAELSADALHVRPRDRADVPGIRDGAAVFKQADAQPVTAVRRLLDQARFPHRGQQSVDRALRPAGLLVKLCQGSGLAAFRQNVEKADRLRNGMYGFAFLFCHVGSLPVDHVFLNYTMTNPVQQPHTFDIGEFLRGMSCGHLWRCAKF